MRIWRSSLYKSPLPEDFPPLCTILCEQDMNCTIEQAIAEAPPVPGALIINDIFEVDHEVESRCESPHARPFGPNPQNQCHHCRGLTPELGDGGSYTLID